MSTPELPSVAALVVNVMSTTPIVFDTRQNSFAGSNSKLDEESLETKKKRAEFCKDRAWWDCTEDATQGVCAFIDGRCKGAPLPIETQPESYYAQWLRLFTPIYANIPKPNINDSGDLVTQLKTRRPRKLSTHRRRRQSSQTR